MTNDASGTLLSSVRSDMPGSSLNVSGEFLIDDSVDALARRYGGSTRPDQELVFEFTRDPALLHQYRLIYEKEFRSVHNAYRYKSVLDEHDGRSHFLMIRQGNLCVGGARLTTRSPRQDHPLPVESSDFRVEKYFPHLKQKEQAYGQVGRICLLPDFRGGDVTRRMFWHIHRKAVALGWEAIFATAAVFNSRMIRKHCLAIGLKETKIHYEINVPPYPMCEEIKMYFISIGMNKAITGAETEPVQKKKVICEEVQNA